MLAGCGGLLPGVEDFKLSERDVLGVPGTIRVRSRRAASKRKGGHSCFARREGKLRIGFIAFNLSDTGGAGVVSSCGSPEKPVAKVVDEHRGLCNIGQAYRL